jgi:nitrogen regulatory protein P-II 1
MKAEFYKIEATIRPHRLEAVQEALYDAEVYGITVYEVRGSGRSRGISHTFRGSQYSQNLTPHMKIEVLVTADQLEEAIKAVEDAANTGEAGDGTLWTVPLGDIVRIRTGERGAATLE